MQATYTTAFHAPDGTIIEGEPRTNSLPFTRVSARAIIVRRRDRALVGMRHHQGANFALPGGMVDDGEDAADALLRELREENVTLHNSDDHWRDRLTTAYFHGYRELALWWIFLVDDADLRPNDETLETRWIRQSEDVWYPLLREKIILALQQYVPDLATFKVTLSSA